MPGKKWLTGLGCIAAVVILWLFKTPILLRLCPGAVLYVRTREVLHILEERFANNPFTWLAESIPDASNCRIRAAVEYSDPEQGRITQNMDLMLQSFPPRMTGEWRSGTSVQNAKLAFYLDEKCAAISPQNGQEDCWYGFSYDAFLNILKDNKLLEVVLGNSATQVQRWMEKPDKIPVMPQLSIPKIPWEQLNTGATGLLALPYQVSRTEEGYWLYTEFTGNLLDRFLAVIPGYRGVGEDIKLSGNFLLRERGISEFVILISEENQNVQISCVLGQDMRRDEMKVELYSLNHGNKQNWTLMIDTRSAEAEQGRITNVSGECMEWHWDPQSVRLTFLLEGVEQGDCAVAVLKGAPEGIDVCVPQTGYLIEKFTGLKLPHMDRWGAGEFSFQEGNSIVTPQYRDFSQWSLEDLFVILESVSGLPGDMIGSLSRTSTMDR